MSAFDDLFDRVVVVNLDRRPDRMALVAAQLDALGVSYRRFAAVDGRAAPAAQAWRAYAAQPLQLPPAAAPVRSYREFYLGDRSTAARIAFMEQTLQAKAIATAGAWGLLASMTAVVEQALAEGWASLLILEDDVLFHRDTLARLAATVRSLPPDWAVLQLGAMQLHWEESWITWHGADLYRCNGSSFGAHAVALRREVLPDLLERCRRRDLPFDTGALQEIKRTYRQRCFTCFPNLAIQDARDSEIGMSRLSAAEIMRAGNVYRWHYPDYGIEAIMGSDRTFKGGMRRARASLAAARRAIGGALGRNPSAPPVVTAKPLPARSPEKPPRFGVAPLGQLGQGRTGEIVLALLVGAAPDQYAGAVALLGRQLKAGKAVPVVVTDNEDFSALRAERLPFEYLPPPGRAAEGYADLPWDVYRLRRLAILRRKYQPLRIIAFGAEAHALLAAWRASPFEADFPGPDLGLPGGDPVAEQEAAG